MVFMEQRLQEPQQLAQWFKQIIRVKPEPGSPGSEGKVQPENEQRDNGWDVPTEMRQWRVFEFADILEQGLGPGLTTSFVEPPGAKEAKERRLIVDIEPDRREYLLSTESGEALLMAATCADGLGFEMFITCGGEPPKALGPAFSLRCNAQRDQWSLCSVRCEKCETLGKRQLGTRELARVNHYCETVGDGNAFCMDVEMPEILEDGSCSVICPVCAGPDADVGGQVLSSRRPKWNARQKTLTLDFRGRCSMASAKNFQLEAENDASKCTLLFGKIASNKFVLDFKHPFGMVQAFAAALTATHWK